MSSFIRSIEKRILKRRGYVRQTSEVRIEGGKPYLHRFKKGEGPILNPEGKPIGRHWPRAGAA